MTATTYLAILLAVAVIVIVVLLALTLPQMQVRAGSRAKLLDDRAADLALTGRLLREQHAIHAHELGVAYQREPDQLRLIVAALTDDRERLISAVLATSPNPQSALTLGRVDQARAAVTREQDLREYLEANRTIGGVVDSETVDSDGRPVIPVGMGNSV